MYSCKAEFFDSQVDAEWARVAYSAEKVAKIARMLDLARVQPGMRILEPGCGTGRRRVSWMTALAQQAVS